ncbi:hypothetical protein EJ04DRAFT_112284 [Polyplosphaeria fusca]|uniref:Secreted protein n=1 Tax=Polyplosphaeria fusca TaxID=682080 RepID=A0A9P4RCE5_9PLEO|nr:hypothetical protein EJ04DRAFT_112284 [Polyplosphaeria fusca]
MFHWAGVQSSSSGWCCLCACVCGPLPIVEARIHAPSGHDGECGHLSGQQGAFVSYKLDGHGRGARRGRVLVCHGHGGRHLSRCFAARRRIPGAPAVLRRAGAGEIDEGPAQERICR